MMSPEKFAKGFYKEKESLLDFYINPENETEVGDLIKSMNLDEKGRERIKQVINGVLKDGFYTILLGINGAAQIGGIQENYKLTDEQNNELTGGEIEAYAWEYFHDHKFEVDKGKADFIAELIYESEGGRTTPAMSGYRPQIKFAIEEIQTSGQQTFIGRDLVFPGDKVNAEINILSPKYFLGKLEEGMKFEFLEGSVLIGKGKILKIVNKELEKQLDI